MTNTRRSLILALVAGAFSLLFIKSQAIFPGVEWVQIALPVLVFAFSALGFVLGLRSLKQEGDGVSSWIPIWLNALILICCLLFTILLSVSFQIFN